MLRPSANLSDTEDIRFVIQQVDKDEWVDSLAVMFTKTVAPWERHRLSGLYNIIVYADPIPAKEAAKAMKAAYPGRYRVIQRSVIVEETLVGEV